MTTNSTGLLRPFFKFFFPISSIPTLHHVQVNTVQSCQVGDSHIWIFYFENKLKHGGKKARKAVRGSLSLALSLAAKFREAKWR